jgi:hypothetical protein
MASFKPSRTAVETLRAIKAMPFGSACLGQLSPIMRSHAADLDLLGFVVREVTITERGAEFLAEQDRQSDARKYRDTLRAAASPLGIDANEAFNEIPALMLSKGLLWVAPGSGCRPFVLRTTAAGDRMLMESA